jgi:hypothetical protein
LWRGKKVSTNTLALVGIPYVTFFAFHWLSFTVFPRQGQTSLVAYTEFFSFSFLSNLWYYIELPAAFFAELPVSGQIVYGISLVFCVAGIAQTIKHDYHFVLYSALTIAIHVVWSYSQGPRYIFAIMPFYIYFVTKGLFAIRFGLPEQSAKVGRILSYGFYGVIVLYFLIFSGTYAYSNIYHERQISGPFDPVSDDMVRVVTQHTEPDDIMIFFKPRVLRMLTGRTSILINDPALLYKGDYLVLHKLMGTYDQISPRAITENPARFNLEKFYENTNFLVYKIAH